MAHPHIWVEKTAAVETNMTGDQFPRTINGFMPFAFKWDACLFVLAGLGHFDPHAVLSAYTSKSVSENKLDSWKEAYI